MGMHDKPSARASRRNWTFTIIAEAVLLLFFFGVMSSAYWYCPIDFSSYMAISHLCADIVDVLMVGFYLAAAVFILHATVHDTPTSEAGRAIYDETHGQDMRIKSRLKLGDDLVQVISSKGRSASGGSVLSTLYEDVNATRDDFPQPIHEKHVDTPHAAAVQPTQPTAQWPVGMTTGGHTHAD